MKQFDKGIKIHRFKSDVENDLRVMKIKRWRKKGSK
jgi:hypothetical protein